MVCTVLKESDGHIFPDKYEMCANQLGMSCLKWWCHSDMESVNNAWRMNRRDKEKCDKSHSCTVITLSSLSCIHVVIKAPVKNTLGSFVNGLNTWAYCLDDLCWTRGNISLLRLQYISCTTNHEVSDVFYDQVCITRSFNSVTIWWCIEHSLESCFVKKYLSHTLEIIISCKALLFIDFMRHLNHMFGCPHMLVSNIQWYDIIIRN